MKILITGVAGFIGFHLAKKLLARGFEVIGIDNLSGDLGSNLKRLQNLGINGKIDFVNDFEISYKNFTFKKMDILNFESLKKLFIIHKFDYIIHLAAKTGISGSVTEPNKYIETNIMGFNNIIELAQKYKIKKFIYASSSSVYGHNDSHKFKEKNKTETPLSIYAVTKKANELQAYTYSNLYGLTTIGLRFFSVYGPFGRSDMAPYIFTKNILEEKEIILNNNGNMWRDFTYIDDVVGIIDIILLTEQEDKYNIYNIGSGNSINIKTLCNILTKLLNKKAIIKNLELIDNKHEMIKTESNNSLINKKYLYKELFSTNIYDGLETFTHWYLSNKK